MLKKTYKYIITFILIFAIFSSNVASAFQISGFELNAKSAMLISLDTDQVLHKKNADQKMYPASLTKILVAVLLLEKVEDLDGTVLTTSEHAHDAILGTGATNIHLKVGEQITARQALNALLICSAADVAYVIAEYVGGDTEGFMAMMNTRAVQLGMKHSSFGNPVGLHDDKTYTTARDIAILAKHALKFKDFVEVVGTARYEMAATNMTGKRYLSTTNFLIDPSTNYYYKPASGIKTGFTDEAGRCVVSTASNGGYNYLCIIMGCNNSDGRQNQFLDSINLYRWAFNNFEYKDLLDISKPVAEVQVDLSMNTDYVQLYPQENIRQILPKNADSSTVTINAHLKSQIVDAPIKSGDILGTAEVIYAGQVLGEVNLVAKENIESNFFLATGRTFGNIFTSPAFKWTVGILIAALVIYIIICIVMTQQSRKKRRKVKYIPYDNDHKNKH